MLAASGTFNPWRTLNVATVLSAISGAPINETVGTDVNGDNDNNDRPIRGINDLHACRSAPRSTAQGRAVINGLERSGVVPGRHVVPLPDAARQHGLDSLDLFYDIFNLFNRDEHVPPTGNRASATSWSRPRRSSRGRCSSASACGSDAAITKEDYRDEDTQPARS